MVDSQPYKKQDFDSNSMHDDDSYKLGLKGEQFSMKLDINETTQGQGSQNKN